MARNYLFSFIKHTVSKSDKSKNFKLKISTTFNNQEVFIYDLTQNLGAVVAKVEGQQFLLAEHHITFFEQTSKDHPSEYHYTASLRDQVGNCYKLHVYFDKNDVITGSSLKEDNQAATVAFPSLLPTLQELAVDQVWAIVGELRENSQNQIKQMRDDYARMEAKLSAMSADLERNLNSYKLLLDELVVHLETLCLYEDSTSLLKLFNRIKQSLNRTEVKKEAHEDEGQDQPLKQVSEGQVKLVVKKPDTRVLKEAQICHASYVNEKDPVKAIDPFLKLLIKVQDLLLSLEDSTQIFAEQHIIEIQNLATFAEKEGKSLLQKLLLSEKYDLALQLKNLTTSLPHNILKIALFKDNAKLLDFLLTHGNFAVNTLTVNGVSLVLYCYLNHTKDTPKVDCLSVLIQHGASLMVKHQGLPVCFYILEEKTALKNAVINNSSRTVNNPNFYKCLVHNLENYLLMQPKDANLACRVEMAIARYQVAKSTYEVEGEYKHKFFNTKSVEAADRAVARLTSGYSTSTRNMIATDPEVSKLREKNDELTKQYMLILASAENKGMMSQVSQMLTKVADGQDGLEANIDKSHLLRFYTAQNYFLELQIRIHNLKQEFKKPNLSKRQIKILSKELDEAKKEELPACMRFLATTVVQAPSP